MLVFATSDKGGTGRSVTSSNLVYRRALTGANVCYLDFDFGSPTAGAIFQLSDLGQGIADGGLHSYLRGRERADDGADPRAQDGGRSGRRGTAAGRSAAAVATVATAPGRTRLVKVDEPRQIDVWTESGRTSLRTRPTYAGKMVLLPGDRDGGEFQLDDDAVDRCTRLFVRLDEEFDLCLVDLSAGRSQATELVLRATARPELSRAVCRWLVFHRWTRQHIPAAAGLAFGGDGIVATGVRFGHDEQQLADSIRFVRTAFVDPDSTALAGLRPSQVAWLRDCHQDLQELAGRRSPGAMRILGTIPLDPVLQWREQLISDNDVYARQIANEDTTKAFSNLAEALIDPAAWESL